MPRRIHIFGASGSGTTTLASRLAVRHGHRHPDTDEFFWLPTDPPYREKRPREARLALLRRALGETPSWVLSGSLCGWGDPLVQSMSDETLPGQTLARNLAVARAVTAGNRNAQLRELAGHDHRGMRPGEREPSAEFMAAVVGWLGNALSAR